MTPAEHKIRVDVETSYLDEQSDPHESRYVFAYTITIRNEGQVPARLLTRHWVITDANGKVEEVRGDGRLFQDLQKAHRVDRARCSADADDERSHASQTLFNSRAHAHSRRNIA